MAFAVLAVVVPTAVVSACPSLVLVVVCRERFFERRVGPDDYVSTARWSDVNEMSGALLFEGRVVARSNGCSVRICGINEI